MTAHDDHYRKVQAAGVQPIEVMEAVVCAGLPLEFHQLAKDNLNRAMACKYLLRCGTKDAPKKEMEKAQNYLFRAQHAIWPWEIDSSCVLDMGGE